MSLKKLQKQSSKCIKKRHWRAFSLSVYSFCGTVSSGAVCYLIPTALEGVQYAAVWSFVCRFLLLTAVIVLHSGMRQGIAAWYTSGAFGKKPSFIQPLYWLRKCRGLRIVPIRLRVLLQKTIVGVLLPLPGIVVLALGFYELREDTLTPTFFYASVIGGCTCALLGIVFAALYCQQYGMIPLLLSLHPDMRSDELLRQSRTYMDGRSVRTFAFKWTLVPWAFCCMIPFLLPFALPHCKMRMACYYAEIYRSNGISADLFAHKHGGDQNADA